VLDGERIAFLGNSTAERMNLFGHFEALLHQRFPGKHLVVRNFARPADEVGNRQRPGDYTKLDDPVAAFGADTYLVFFGFNESFAGPGGVAKFTANYEKLLGELAQQYPRDDTKAAPRFVIVSPIAVEASGSPYLPDAEAQNNSLALYRDAAKAVAEKRGLAFVDLYCEADALPPPEIVAKFLRVLDAVPGPVAVHSAASLVAVAHGRMYDACACLVKPVERQRRPQRLLLGEVDLDLGTEAVGIGAQLAEGITDCDLHRLQHLDETAGGRLGHDAGLIDGGDEGGSASVHDWNFRSIHFNQRVIDFHAIQCS
jgi:lysophospholipase L1-like esterase